MEEQDLDISKIDIRSEEVHEILGATPHWIIRTGISIIFAVVIALLLGSWFFKYPDVITSQISLTTENPPASLQALTSGKITELFYIENQEVKRSSIIAIIENTANYKHIAYLSSVIDTITDVRWLNNTLNLNLGELQTAYSAFSRLVKDFKIYHTLDYYKAKIRSVQQQKSDYNLYLNRIWEQRNIQERVLQLAAVQFERGKTMFSKGVYAKADYEEAEKTYLQQKLSLENIQTTIANTQMQINQLDQTILDLQLQDNKDSGSQSTAINEAINNLKSEILKWEKTYIVKSPIDGKVTFTKVWSKNQNVQAGEIVATIIPQHESRIIGKVKIPSQGMGKVKVKQVVNIKLDNFPYMEFGILRGKIKTISLIPTQTEQGSFYTAEIEIPIKMTSNYGKTLGFSQEMTGTAEIITDDVRLLERLFNPLKFIWKNNL